MWGSTCCSVTTRLLHRRTNTKSHTSRITRHASHVTHCCAIESLSRILPVDATTLAPSSSASDEACSACSRSCCRKGRQSCITSSWLSCCKSHAISPRQARVGVDRKECRHCHEEHGGQTAVLEVERHDARAHAAQAVSIITTTTTTTTPARAHERAAPEVRDVVRRRLREHDGGPRGESVARILRHAVAARVQRVHLSQRARRRERYTSPCAGIQMVQLQELVQLQVSRGAGHGVRRPKLQRPHVEAEQCALRRRQIALCSVTTSTRAAAVSCLLTVPLLLNDCTAFSRLSFIALPDISPS